jgi:hypothetical protein
MSRPPSDDAPFSALAFKIMTDPFVGSLTFCRIYRWVGLGPTVQLLTLPTRLVVIGRGGQCWSVLCRLTHLLPHLQVGRTRS